MLVLRNGELLKVNNLKIPNNINYKLKYVWFIFNALTRLDSESISPIPL